VVGRPSGGREKFVGSMLIFDTCSQILARSYLQILRFSFRADPFADGANRDVDNACERD
jgi:hypothetical protein